MRILFPNVTEWQKKEKLFEHCNIRKIKCMNLCAGTHDFTFIEKKKLLVIFSRFPFSTIFFKFYDQWLPRMRSIELFFIHGIRRRNGWKPMTMIADMAYEKNIIFRGIYILFPLGIMASILYELVTSESNVCIISFFRIFASQSSLSGPVYYIISTSDS